MTFSQTLVSEISHLNLLKHPFYQAWMKGELSLDTLKDYTAQYYPHVKAFPRFVSAVHSQCEDTASRRELLENLMDEEGMRSGVDHPTLWKMFGEGLGMTSDSIENAKIKPKAAELLSTYWSLMRSSYAEGLGALYAYENQIPEIATAKIEGLKKQYGIDDAQTVAFFAVHEKADVFHSEACGKMLDRLSDEEKQKAMQAAKTSAQALWDFLTEVHGTHC